MKKKQKEIIMQDIADLEYLMKLYSKEKQFGKVSECAKEIDELKKKLKGD